MRTRKQQYIDKIAIEKAKKTSTTNNVGTQTSKSREIDRDLEEIYVNTRSTPSYSAKIIQFLKKNENHSLHRRIVKRKYTTRKIITHYPRQIFMADLIEYSQPGLKHAIGDYKYILVVIHCFSKMLWTRLMKKKDKNTTSEAFQSILSSMDNHPNTIITDDGLEFFNKDVKDVFKTYGIHLYSTKSDEKASMAERVIQTIKRRLEKTLYANKSKPWIDYLEQTTKNYNNTPHRSISMAPSRVNDLNREKVFKAMFPNIEQHMTPRLSKGDLVRVLLKKKLFDKGYKRAWSKKLNNVASVHQKSGVVWYKLLDPASDKFNKTRYYSELIKV
jgi:hypothetical protein